MGPIWDAELRVWDAKNFGLVSPGTHRNKFVKKSLCINYKHNSSQIQLFSLLDCSVYLVTGVGGKLSRPVYLDPHPPEYQSKIILLILLILNYLNVMMYQL